MFVWSGEGGAMTRRAAEREQNWRVSIAFSFRLRFDCCSFDPLLHPEGSRHIRVETKFNGANVSGARK